MKARTKLEHRRHPAARDDPSGVRIQDAGDALQEGRLPRSIAADDPEAAALGDFKRNIVKRFEVVMHASTTPHDGGPEGVIALAIEPKGHGHIVDRYGGGVHSSRPRFRSLRTNTIEPITKNTTALPAHHRLSMLVGQRLSYRRLRKAATKCSMGLSSNAVSTQ